MGVGSADGGADGAVGVGCVGRGTDETVHGSRGLSSRMHDVQK